MDSIGLIKTMFYFIKMVNKFNHIKTASQYDKKHIVVTSDVYEQIRSLGKLGDTFNDVVKRLLLLGKETTTNTTTNSNLKDRKGEI